MKKYTQEEFDAFDVINGVRMCPTGDYSDINAFGEGCSFGVGCSFGEWCSFGVGCSFGEGCSTKDLPTALILPVTALARKSEKPIFLGARKVYL